MGAPALRVAQKTRDFRPLLPRSGHREEQKIREYSAFMGMGTHDASRRTTELLAPSSGSAVETVSFLTFRHGRLKVSQLIVAFSESQVDFMD
jgi:hypothetical protein